MILHAAGSKGHVSRSPVPPPASDRQETDEDVQWHDRRGDQRRCSGREDPCRGMCCI